MSVSINMPAEFPCLEIRLTREGNPKKKYQLIYRKVSVANASAYNCEWNGLAYKGEFLTNEEHDRFVNKGYFYPRGTKSTVVVEISNFCEQKVIAIGRNALREQYVAKIDKKNKQIDRLVSKMSALNSTKLPVIKED